MTIFKMALTLNGKLPMPEKKTYGANCSFIVLSFLEALIKKHNLQVKLSSLSVSLNLAGDTIKFIETSENSELKDSQLQLLRTFIVMENPSGLFESNMCTYRAITIRDIIVIPYEPRILRGYNDERMAIYHSRTPIVFDELFNKIKVGNNGKVDNDVMKPLVEASLTSHIAYILRESRENIKLKIIEISGFFTKVDYGKKSQVAFSIKFSCNCSLPIAVGEHTEIGFGLLALEQKVDAENFQDAACGVDKQELNNRENGSILELDKSGEKQKVNDTVNVKFPEYMTVWLEKKASELDFSVDQYLKLMVHTEMHKSLHSI